MVLDRLIVKDNVSGLADKSEEFANFLTVSWRYGLTGVYIFHTIYRQGSTGKWYFHRQKYIIFFLDQFKLLL